MAFTDITVVPVRTDQKQAYLELSSRMATVYREYGALRIIDCWQSEDAGEEDFHAADAMKNYQAGTLPNMRQVAGASEEETVVVSITEWPNREVRDKAIKAIIVDPRVQATMEEEPVFDGRRVIAGGFRVELEVP